jgi:hypothetical protein
LRDRQSQERRRDRRDTLRKWMSSRMLHEKGQAERPIAAANFATLYHFGSGHNQK